MKSNRQLSVVVTLILSLLGTPYFLSSAFAQHAPTELNIEVITSGLNYPWGMAFLPNGQLLVTERVGRLRIISTDGKISGPIKGVPPVFNEDQGGLLDVVLDPDFSNNRTIYFSYAEPQGKIAGTAVAKAKLVNTSLENVEVIFRQHPKTDGAKHFGSRLVFAPDGNLFITLGDRSSYMDESQLLDNHLGKLVRIQRNGSAPKDNPFIKNPETLPEIWSYGHRHIQGAAIHPETGELWIHEHGPRGGDEINIPQPGKNYGWPEASYGIHYWMTPIKDEHAEQGFEEPIYYWTPSIAPSGMLFYTGSLFPEWRNNLFIGALAGQHLVRLVTKGNRIIREEKLLKNSARIRDIAQGPAGELYVLTDEKNGKLIKITRASSK